jgi:hypothetical protein
MSLWIEYLGRSSDPKPAPIYLFIRVIDVINTYSEAYIGKRAFGGRRSHVKMTA